MSEAARTIDGAARPRRRTETGPGLLRPILLASAMVLAGGLLIVLAVPRLSGGLSLIWTAPAMRAIGAGEKFDRDRLEELAGDLSSAAGWIEDGRVHTDLGVVLRDLAQQSGYLSEEGQAELAEAAYHIRIGLTQSPVDPYGWLHLAAVLDALAAPPAEILDALRMSVLSGPYEPNLFNLRVTIALKYWADQNEETRGLVERQLRLAWSRIPVVIVQRAMAFDRMFEVAEALDSMPGAREEYRTRLRRWLGIKPPDS